MSDGRHPWKKCCAICNAYEQPAKRPRTLQELKADTSEGEARLEMLREECRIRLSQPLVRLVEPDPPPRYDDVFYAGLEALESC